MRLGALFAPKPTLSDQERASGLRWFTWQGMVSMGFGSITSSGFLTAFALVLGANNLQVGILAALPFLTQPLQIPAIVLVEKLRRRKLISVVMWGLAQLLWFPIALIPFFLEVPHAGAVSTLLGLMAVRGVLSAVFGSAWNGWLRDMVPQQILGRFMSRRLALANVTAMVFGLGAALFVDFWKGQVSVESQVFAYAYALLFGAVTLGMSAPVFMAMMPEPLMQAPQGPKTSLWSGIAAPFRDSNYKHLLRFLFFWGLAINLATPFFAVYMLSRLGLPLTLVMGLSVLSQLFNVIFLRVWGPLSDRVGIKGVLSVCASLYLLVVLGWTFTSMPERYFLTIPLLVVLHALAGIASAGVSLTTGTIGMKLAPEGRATGYLAAAALANNLGAGIGPLIGGRLADFFSVHSLSLDFTWASPGSSFNLPALNLTGFDFLFSMAFLLGLLTMNSLTALREEGEVGREVVLEALLAPARDLTRPMSTVPGLAFLSHFPYGYLRRVPIPGLDVALGVTAYQIAEAARLATLAVTRGRGATLRLIGVLENTVSRIWKGNDVNEAHAMEVARQVGRGTIHAVEQSLVDAGQLAHQAVLGVVRALGRKHVGPRHALRGVGYGVVQGALEAGIDPREAVSRALEAAKQAGHERGLLEDEALSWMARGMLEAAEAHGPDALAQVQSLLPEGLMSPEERPPAQ